MLFTALVNSGEDDIAGEVGAVMSALKRAANAAENADAKKGKGGSRTPPKLNPQAERKAEGGVVTKERPQKSVADRTGAASPAGGDNALVVSTKDVADLLSDAGWVAEAVEMRRLHEALEIGALTTEELQTACEEGQELWSILNECGFEEIGDEVFALVQMLAQRVRAPTNEKASSESVNEKASSESAEAPNTVGKGEQRGRSMEKTSEAANEEEKRTAKLQHKVKPKLMQPQKKIREAPEEEVASVEPPSAKLKTQSVSEHCIECGEDIGVMDFLRLPSGRCYHLHCFRCSRCDKVLDSKAFCLEPPEDRPVCNNCYEDFVAARCGVCGKPILGGQQVFQIGDERVHAACQQCAVCGKAYRTMHRSDGKSFCRHHKPEAAPTTPPPKKTAQKKDKRSVAPQLDKAAADESEADSIANAVAAAVAIRSAPKSPSSIAKAVAAAVAIRAAPKAPKKPPPQINDLTVTPEVRARLVELCGSTGAWRYCVLGVSANQE